MHSHWIIEDARRKIIDFDFKQVVAISSLADLPIQAASTLIMD